MVGQYNARKRSAGAEQLSARAVPVGATHASPGVGQVRQDRATHACRLQVCFVCYLLLLISACAAHRDSGTLRVVFWAGLEEQKIEQANVVAFMEQNPGVTVQLESIPDNYLEKLVTSFAANKPPDVLLLDSVLVPKFLDGGVLLDMQPYLAADPQFDPGVFFPQVYEIATREGGDGAQQVYALPKDFTPLVVYYNKRLFDAAGLEYPQDGWTWDDFRATCAALTQDTDGDGRNDEYGTLIYVTPIFNITWFWQAGGDVLGQHGDRATGYLDSPECLEALKFFTGLVADGYSPDPTAREALGGSAFMGGKVGMTISGHWAMPGFRAAAERDSNAISLDDIGVVGLPRHRERVTVIYESGWAVAKDTPRPELAVKLARYLSGPECQRRRSQMGLAVSANREVALEAGAGDPRERVFYDEVQYGRAPWGTRITDWSVVEDLLAEGIERVILGYSTPEDALGETAQLIDDELSMF